MRYRNPAKRINDFKEVALGLTEKQAVKEADRCLQCKKPHCVAGCPVEIDIPKFISFVKEKDYLGLKKLESLIYCLPYAAEYVHKKTNVRVIVY